ncbi:MAG TPA: ATP-binding protein [Steroidobacteraceae bacterium]|nr:ATP-binding protein [Steroidobacteraceae bacterium]
MKLRTRLNLVVTGLTAVFVAVLLIEEIQDTRDSVREEIEAANGVASQLLGRLAVIYSRTGGTEVVLQFLQQLGHIRANDIVLRTPAGEILYTSPPATYKAGHEAPAWFSHLMAPQTARHIFPLPGGAQLVVQAQPSRAILDAWDNITKLLILAVVMLVVVNGLAFWSVERALTPFPAIVAGLRRVQRGELTFRLPPLPGTEAREIGMAFNTMAQAVESNVQAERKAREAETRLEERRELSLLVEQRVEEERRLIAHELHDEFGQSVTAIRSLALAIATQSKEPPMSDAARLISEEAARLYDAMHGLIPRLLPVSLDTLGLAETLENLVRDWQRRNPNITLSLHHDLPVDLGPSVTLAAYRVVQEGLINALRHAQATNIEINLESRQDQHMIVTVTDDGIGLPSSWSRPGHFGLRGLTERVAHLGGQLTVRNREPHGVALTAEIPLATADKPAAVTAVQAVTP